MVPAPYSGAALTGAIGVTSTIGVALAGSALLNTLVPPPVPSTSLNSSFGNTPAPSPTYSLQAQGNQARLSQPIPVVYGQPSIPLGLNAMLPCIRITSNIHTSYIGQGEYDLEQIRIEDTPISLFEESDYEIVQPGDSVTLFDADVFTARKVTG